MVTEAEPKVSEQQAVTTLVEKANLTKEPWQYDKREFAKAVLGDWRYHMPGLDTWHEQAIYKAVLEGKKVPRKAIDDYPVVAEDLKVTSDLSATGGNPRQGLDIEAMKSRPAFLYQGRDKGVLVDGSLLIKDKGITDKIIGNIEKQEKAHDIKRYLKNMPKEKAQEFVDKQWEAQTKVGAFPDTDALIPNKSSFVSELKLVGVSRGSQGGGQTAYLSDGENITAVNADKLAFMHQHLPSATMMYSGSKERPVSFVLNDEVKGALMPRYGNQGAAEKLREAMKRVKYELAQPSPATKEPWQMTKAKFEELRTAEHEAYDAFRTQILKEASLEHPYSKEGELSTFSPKARELYADLQEAKKKRRQATQMVLNQMKSEGGDPELFTWSISTDSPELHQKSVRGALFHHKPVPAEVLKDYPGLKAPKQARKPRIKAEKPKAVKAEPTEHKETTYVVSLDDNRSPHAIAVDRGLLAKEVVTKRNKKGVARWRHSPNQMDVRGVDTPRASRQAHGPGIMDSRGRIHKQKRGTVV